ncbi:MAG TPA: 4-(cytidine 5'-diphospho)-2-C-methyl-D-erythritol kinase [Firmicutes bacterium]|nr:4-(cytidine 5'-diphospho)-2-C-methyl-D-erythritol kinase [Candidatus Fermentithermobacillaceae bacterium]
MTRFDPERKIIEYRAYAKINLALSVLGKRADGYHDIVTVMVPVGIFDVVTLERQPQGLSVFCPDLFDLPQENNLAYKAARALMSKAGIDLGIKIEIQKNIPPGSGMGGGSSDAAATLLGIDWFLRKGADPDLGFLMEVGAHIGADVPFFLGCNSHPPVWDGAICTGIGDKVEPLSPPRYWLVLVVPEVQVSTRWAYSLWNPGSYHHEKTAGESRGADLRVRATVDALLSGDPEHLARTTFNDLEKGVASFHEEITRIKEKLLSSGALAACMTGSGSAVYGICRSFEHATLVRERFSPAAADLPIKVVTVVRTGVGGNED